MKNKTTILLTWIIILLPFIAAIILWDKIPTQLAVHLNNKHIENKLVAILSLPIISLLIFLSVKFILKLLIDKSKLSFFENRINNILLAIHSCLTALFLINLSYTLNDNVPVFILLSYTLLITFLIIGNYFNAIKPNRFFGIRTPWTIRSEITWRKTHFIASRLWVFSSLLMMLIIPFCSEVVISILMLIYFITIIITPIIYSFIISKKQSI